MKCRKQPEAIAENGPTAGIISHRVEEIVA